MFKENVLATFSKFAGYSTLKNCLNCVLLASVVAIYCNFESDTVLFRFAVVKHMYHVGSWYGKRIILCTNGYLFPAIEAF